MGTPLFALTSLKALFHAKFPILAVFTQPDRPAGRGRHLHTPPCAVFAREKKIPLYQPEEVKTEAAAIQNLKPDFIVTAAYGQFVPRDIREAASLDAVNLHASLLPCYRGAAPAAWAIINGDLETGVTLMRMTGKMDAGPIYSQNKMAIAPHDTAASLLEKLGGLGASLLLSDLPKIASEELEPAEQNEALITTAPPLRKEDGRVKWDRNAVEISRLVRGCNPWPAATTSIDNKSVKIYDASPLPEKTGSPPGTIVLLNEGGIVVACRASTLALREVQLEGKRKMPAADFARGFRLKEGNRFG